MSISFAIITVNVIGLFQKKSKLERGGVTLDKANETYVVTLHLVSLLTSLLTVTYFCDSEIFSYHSVSRKRAS